MVYGKIKFAKILIVALLMLIFVFGIIFNKNQVQYNLVKAILPSSISETSNITALSDITSKTIHVIFEDEDEDNLEEIKDNFASEIDTADFEITEYSPEKLLEYYLSQSSNFISPNTRELLKDKDYEIVHHQALERLYNPGGFQIAGVDKDPYSFLSDFVLSNNRDKKSTIDNKNYDILDLKLRQNTDRVKDLILLRKNFEGEGTKIYLTGTPVHTYYTSTSANLTVNVICALITLLIVGLTWVYFKNLKILLFIGLSIIFGFLGGFFVAKATFLNFHIITVLFGVTLIGIGVDYSIHYLFSAERDKNFYKNLTLSMLSTALAFSLLFFLKIEVMSQIALFTISGLICVYLFILLIYPCVDFPPPQKTFNTDLAKKFKISVLTICLVVTGFGVFHHHFDDNLSALYTPKKELKEGEALYLKLTNPNDLKARFLTVKGDNLEDILTKEEEISGIFDNNMVNYLSLSKFLPSEKRQRENFELVKSLYNNDLSSFGDILTSGQISALKNQEFNFKEFNLNEAPYLKNFVLKDNTSFMMYYSSDKISLNKDFALETDIQGDVSDYLKHYRVKLLKLLPAVYFLLFVLFFAFYEKKRAVKMFLPILLSSLFTISLLSLFFELNLFHLLALLLVLGFTVDYSLFSSQKSENTKNAILLAGITTSASFLLLSFSGFALLSSLSLTLFIGILSSYFLIKVFE
ncbi:hypothetical protein IKQ26_04750 [bacterium]|nr:hypothetical protein [bacterium]